MLQNYAKFGSRVANESVNYQYVADIGERSFPLPEVSLRSAVRIVEGLLGLTIPFFMLGMVILAGIILLSWAVSSVRKGPKEGFDDMTVVLGKCRDAVLSVIRWAWGVVVSVLRAIWRHKVWTILAIIVLAGWSFTQDVLNGTNPALRLLKVREGTVTVDLRRGEILEPGYHLVSPIFSEFVSSPTGVFSFEIAEVTAKTSEELGVTLDYRVGFLFKRESLLPFYKKYGPKNIETVSSDVVMPRLLEAIKSVIQGYSYKDISSQHAQIKEQVSEKANAALSQLGIEINEVNILDIRLPESHLRLKEDLLNAENQKRLAEAKLETQRKESEARKLQAETDKAVTVIAAEASAKANEILGNQRISPELIELRKIESRDRMIEKWDGKLPSGAAGADPFGPMK